MLSSRAVTVSQCCNPESALTAQALLLRWCADSLGCASSRGLFVCLFVRSFVRSFSRLVFSFGSFVWFVRFLARLFLCIGRFVQVGINATLIIYAYYILTGYVNKMLMSPIVALTYNQVGTSRAKPIVSSLPPAASARPAPLDTLEELPPLRFCAGQARGELPLQPRAAADVRCAYYIYYVTSATTTCGCGRTLCLLIAPRAHSNCAACATAAIGPAVAPAAPLTRTRRNPHGLPRMVFCLLTAACFGASTASTRRCHSCCVCDASAAHYAPHILLPAACCNFTIACSARSATWCQPWVEA
jgi:hypothetical protein